MYKFSQKTGRVSGLLAGLDQHSQTKAMISLMVSEAVKTSEIEGEYLNRQDVMSSIRNHLGLDQKKVKDQRAEGAAELMLDVRHSYADPLTEGKLFAWHRMLMKGNTHVNAGRWRVHKEPMQVVSGAMGKERVHFEAPPSSRVPEEMERFIRWFNQTGPGGSHQIRKPVVRSALAHLYFESIHPFKDGNGRMGRVIAEKALFQEVDRPILLSLSRVIESDKKTYYQSLQQAQRTMEVSYWINYFVQIVLTAQEDAEKMIAFTLQKARFFDRWRSQLNERQLKVIRRMLEEGPQGFEGGMNARKYVSIAKTSKATATRDLQDLFRKGILTAAGGGRSTSYQLTLSGD